MLPSFLMIDDFLANADAARAAALKLVYDPANKHGNYPGLLSDRPLVIPGLEDAVAGLIGQRVKPAEGTSHNHCRVTLKNDRGVTGVHIDPCFYSGILYLSRPEDCRGGTDFYRHRRTGLDRVPNTIEGVLAAGYANHNRLIEDVVNADTNKPARWERSFTAPMRYNRLILFSPWLFHDAASGFGDRPDNGRLVQLMFFNAA